MLRIISEPSILRLQAFYDAYVASRELSRIAAENYMKRKDRLAEIDSRMEAYRQNGHSARSLELSNLALDRLQAEADSIGALSRLRQAQEKAQLPERLWSSARNYAAENIELGHLPAELREAIQ